jgi:hypothetical protein
MIKRRRKIIWMRKKRAGKLWIGIRMGRLVSVCRVALGRMRRGVKSGGKKMGNRLDFITYSH